MEIKLLFIILSYAFLFFFMMILWYMMRSDHDSSLRWMRILAIGTEKEKVEAIEQAERNRTSVHAGFLIFSLTFFLAVACVWTWSFLGAQETLDSEKIEVIVMPIRGWNATPWPGRWGGP